ncbi:lipopolysaccharide biosynthesis protein [uncultured Shewanella sp.]|uniref:lipopolysaccharide biosynthesis protein n=1 Tax=uncultured Shewanella sp. TaxID=173975 RepID=UPI0026016677|nr:oligosaccharide flippase family protein [uncultured Shewanella sp.]
MFSLLNKDSYWSSVGTVITGTLGAQLIFLMLLPLVTYLYEPTEYGYYTTLLGYAIILSSFIGIGLERAIPLIERKIRYSYTFTLLLYSFIFCFLIAGVSIFINYFLDLISFFDVIIIVALAFLLFTLNSLSFYNISVDRFNLDAESKFLQAVILNVGQILIFFASSSKLSLILADFISKVYIVFRVNKKLYHYKALNMKLMTWKRFTSKNRRLKSFFTYGLISSLLVSLSMNLPYVLIPINYDYKIAALVYLAMKIASIPTALIGSAIGKVFFAKASQLTENKMILQLFIDNLKKLSIIAILLIPIFLLSSYLLPNVLGDSWEDITLIINALIFLSISQLVANPLSLVATVYKMQSIDVIINLIRVFFVFSVFFGYSSFNKNYIETFYVYSVGMCIIYICNIFTSYYIIKSNS